MLTRISDHVYWMPPADPDRPSLCAVAGENFTLMLDSGASDAHARQFLDQLAAQNVAPPRYVALTHWHWDHIFGAAEIDAPVIAHVETARHVTTQAGYAWDDAALDARVADGLEIAMCADDIKVELPEPRAVRFRLPEIVFESRLDIDLGGGVTCHLQHVGGDHAADSVVMFIAPDNVLFLGDCLYNAVYAPVTHHTIEKALPLADLILASPATQYVWGHQDSVMNRAALEADLGAMRYAAELVTEVGGDQAAARKKARAAKRLNEDTEFYIESFAAGFALMQAASEAETPDTASGEPTPDAAPEE